MEFSVLKNLLKEKRYYREWLTSVGWGVMLNYDTVRASTKRAASKKNKPSSMYAYDRSFERVEKVKEEHLHLTDVELSNIYGEKEN